MILLDTNVLADSSRPRPDPSAKAWIIAQRPAELFICTPVLAELRYGVERLPTGRRRTDLEEWVRKIEQDGFPDRILSFDRSAAHEFGRLFHERVSMGRPIATLDAMIAAIALGHGAALATRDVDDFTELGIEIINPFAFSVS
jgi:predicted nucleic acid-binding protein